MNPRFYSQVSGGDSFIYVIMSGYIKIHRSMQRKGWYRKPGYVFLWIHILMKANYSDSEFWFNGQLIKLKPGQFVTGRNQLALETALSGSFIERALKVFESEQQIEQQTNNRNRLITILNYDLYQQTEQPKNKIRTTSGQQADTNKELEESKESKESIIPAFEIFKSYAIEKKPKVCPEALKRKYDVWVESDWHDGNGNKIINWKTKLINTIPYLPEGKIVSKNPTASAI